MDKEHNEETHSESSNTFRALAYFSQIGVTIAASVMVSVFLGKYLDRLFDTSPWMILIFSIVGVGAAIRAILSMPSDKKQ